jgi:hypothetical protein
MMIRKTFSALALLAVTGMVLVGCGKEDLTEMDNTWGKKEADVVAKLSELQAKHGELSAKFGTVQVANVADTAKAADRAMVETSLKNEETAVGTIETTINDLKAKRAEAMAAGKKGEYEAAWKDAEAKYEAALKQIDELEKQNSDLSSKINGLGSATPATTVDTAAMNGTGSVKSDTATAAANSKTGTSTTETANGTGSKAANGTSTSTTNGSAAAEKSTSTDTKANDKKPVIEKNKNP